LPTREVQFEIVREIMRRCICSESAANLSSKLPMNNQPVSRAICARSSCFGKSRHANRHLLCPKAARSRLPSVRNMQHQQGIFPVGKRESGTARLEEATSFRDALPEVTSFVCGYLSGFRGCTLILIGTTQKPRSSDDPRNKGTSKNQGFRAFCGR
jgi:hypothetical protein